MALHLGNNFFKCIFDQFVNFIQFYIKLEINLEKKKLKQYLRETVY